MFHVEPSKLSGTISVPPSKSHTLRALLFGALADGKTLLENSLESPDSEAMMMACRHLGAKIEKREKIVIDGIGGNIQCSGTIDAGNSGIVLRFLTALSAHSPFPTQIIGDASLCRRPMEPLLGALVRLGAKVESNKGYAPLTIQGPIKSGLTHVLGEDSQFVSALLIAGTLFSELEFEVTNPGERPWVALTLDWLKRFSIPYKNNEYSHYKVYGKRISGFTYQVPADFSSAAFPLIAALVTNSEITIPHLDLADSQGDKMIIPLLQQMGANIEVKKNTLKVSPNRLKGLSIDVNDCIDSIPALAVVACFAEGKTQLYNAKVARTKECDRLHAVATELQKMGAKVEEREESLVIERSQLFGTRLSSYGDHRMAMALSVAALGAKGPSLIEDTACVAKTFPGFVQKMAALGANIYESDSLRHA